MKHWDTSCRLGLLYFGLIRAFGFIIPEAPYKKQERQINNPGTFSAIEETVPVLKENGGYIFSSDYSIPSSVSLENMKAIVETMKCAGRF